MENLENIIESILYVAGGAVEKSIIMEKLEITKKELDNAVSKLEEKYSENSGIYLLKFKDKLQFSTNSTYADQVSIVLQKVKERMLSKTVIETAAIVAYKQPITRAEIEATRGNAPSDYAIQTLLRQKLIQVVGRKEALGRPYLFGTTDEFLKRFNISDITQLPEYEDTIEQLRVINMPIEETKGIYNEFDIPEDEIIPEENLFGETNVNESENLNENSEEKEFNVYDEILNEEEVLQIDENSFEIDENDLPL